MTGNDAIASMRVMFDMAAATWRSRLLASNGDQVALVEYDISGTDGVVGEIEVKTLTVVEIDGDGRIVRQESFDTDEPEKAEAEMHALAAALAAQSVSTPDPLAISARDARRRRLEEPSRPSTPSV